MYSVYLHYVDNFTDVSRSRNEWKKLETSLLKLEVGIQSNRQG